VVFLTLEDETGPLNTIVWSSLFEHERRIVLGARLMGVAGEVQREGEVVHLIAHKLEDRTALLGVSGRCRGISVSPKVPSTNDTGSFIMTSLSPFPSHPHGAGLKWRSESLSENSVSLQEGCRESTTLWEPSSGRARPRVPSRANGAEQHRSKQLLDRGRRTYEQLSDEPA